MMQAGMAQMEGQPVEAVMREELARGDFTLDTSSAILRHLLADDGQSLFSDDILARVRGMLNALADQLLTAHTKAMQVEDIALFLDLRREPVCRQLLENTAILFHLHALAIEWQLTERLRGSAGIDTVLTPLLQALIASDDPSVASAAMGLLASQVRFVQQVARMELSLNELPGDLFHTALLTMRSCAEEGEDAAAAAAEATLRAGFDESSSRMGLASRLVTGMGSGAMAALAVSHAGVAIFLTALALGSGQPRSTAVMATNERQLARLALGLRAAGLKPAAIEEQFALIHPDVLLPVGFDQLRVDRAAALLANSAPVLAG